MDISKARVVIVTHSLVYGAPQALREYLIQQKVRKILFISHPLLIDDSRSSIELIKKSRIIKITNNNLRTKIPVLNYILESILTLYWLFVEKGKFDLYIGVDPLNCAMGVFLKKLGKINKLIYYTIDYVPQRFSNQLLNNIYHRIDKYCLSNADEAWNVSKRIAEGREKMRGLSRNRYPKQKVVPIGVWMKRVKRLPFNKIKKHQLLFVGNLLEKQGVQLVLEAMPSIIRRVPDFQLLIVGGGEYESKLRQKVKELHLENHATFTGWVKDRKKLDLIMADSALAIAMYDKKKDTFTYYADPTKLKDYLSAGLPILLTDIPHNALEIEKNKCGLIIKYDKVSISRAVVSLMKDEDKLKEFRLNALKYIRQFEWVKVFEKALSTI